MVDMFEGHPTYTSDDITVELYWMIIHDSAKPINLHSCGKEHIVVLYSYKEWIMPYRGLTDRLSLKYLKKVMPSGGFQLTITTPFIKVSL